MANAHELADVDVLVPNLKRRLSGVTATIVRLVPIQAQKMALVAVAPTMPEDVPTVSPARLLTMPRNGPNGARIWHARRNTEMLAGLALKHLIGKKLKLIFTSASQRHHTGYTKWLISRMDHVIATSERTATYLERSATVIYHGIDADQFAPGDKTVLRARLGLPDCTLVGCYGRIRGQKGTGDFLEAMLRILPDRPDLHAVIMGRATEKHVAYERGLRARVEETGLTQQVHFKPEVTVDQMPDWYAALDVFVAPQRWEGFGLTPLEAMACGVPTIATTVGAFPELIEDGVTGALIAPEEVVQMADTIAAAVDDPGRLTAQGHAARKHVEEHHRIQAEAEAIMTIYRNLLAD